MDFSKPGKPAVAAVVPGRAPATFISYHENGKSLFVASEADARLQVIDCMEGVAKHPPLKAERESIYVVQATHHEHTVLFAGKGSTAQPVGQRNTINYWSLYDNKIMRKFRGHSERITALSMSPADDTFLSSSADRSVRLWNAQQAGCLAELKLPPETSGSPLAVFDSTGLVFCVSAAMAQSEGRYVHLYDARNVSGGAFAELKVSQLDLEKAIVSHTSNTDLGKAAQLSRVPWRSLAFNVSGSSILVGADMGLAILLDGFEGTVQRVFWDGKVLGDRPAAVCFTPDDRTILSGLEDGSITCWDVATGMAIKRLEGHPGPVECIAANPKYDQIASCCSQIALWSWGA